MSDLTLRLITGDHVQALLPMPRAIALMREAFAQLSAGRAEVPVRTGVEAPETGCRTLVMPSYLPDQRQVGLKVVTVQEQNAARSLPTIHGLMLVLDAETGRPVALLDAEALTAIRTGAASGLATDLLARPDARVAAIFGAGAQARTQLEAVCAVRPIERALVFSRTREKAERLAAEMAARLGLEVRAVDAPEALREADVICTATTAVTPVFSADNVKPGAHLNGIGAYRPDMAEIPADLLLRARVVVDHRASCLEEAGDLLQPLEAGLFTEEQIYAEIGELVLGRKPGRTSAEEITVFKSVGNAVQDLAAAGFVVAEAERLGLGTEATL